MEDKKVRTINDRVLELTGGRNGEELSILTGLSQPTISRLLRTEFPSRGCLNALCVAFNVNLAWLLNGVGDKHVGVKHDNGATTVEAVLAAQIDLEKIWAYMGDLGRTITHLEEVIQGVPVS